MGDYKTPPSKNDKCHVYLYVLFDEVEGDDVLGAPGDDHVSVLLGRDAELLEGGLDEGRVLVQHVLQIPSSLRNVTENSSRRHHVKMIVQDKILMEDVSTIRSKELDLRIEFFMI